MRGLHRVRSFKEKNVAQPKIAALKTFQPHAAHYSPLDSFVKVDQVATLLLAAKHPYSSLNNSELVRDRQKRYLFGSAVSGIDDVVEIEDRDPL